MRTRAWISGSRARTWVTSVAEPRAALLEEFAEALAFAQPHRAQVVERLLEQRAARA